jgi:hypothetical protein
MQPTNKVWGSFLLTMGLVITAGGLLDAGLFIGWGLRFTLSQYVADSLSQSGGVFLFFIGGAFTAGMLANHFTGFGMEKSDVVALKARISELEKKLFDNGIA